MSFARLWTFYHDISRHLRQKKIYSAIVCYVLDVSDYRHVYQDRSLRSLVWARWRGGFPAGCGAQQCRIDRSLELQLENRLNTVCQSSHVDLSAV